MQRILLVPAYLVVDYAGRIYQASYMMSNVLTISAQGLPLKRSVIFVSNMVAVTGDVVEPKAVSSCMLENTPNSLVYINAVSFVRDNVEQKSLLVWTAWKWVILSSHTWQ